MPRRLASLSLALALIAPPALAQPAATPAEHLEARAADIVAVMQGTRAADQVFTPGFIAAVPPAQFAGITGQLTAQNGKLVGAEDIKALGNGTGSMVLRFERARAAALVQLEPGAPFKVAGFRITGVTPLDDGPDRITADFAALHGRAGFAVMRLTSEGPVPVLAHKADEQFAIGSALKLWVLDAVAEDVAAGRLRWDQVVRLGLRSLPSGQMQDWPDNAPVTVETLATMMIAISDNTATDTLIRLVGRDKVAARLRANRHSDPARTLPFLTTLEAFALKSGELTARDAYGAANHSDQQRMLDQLAKDLSPARVDGRKLGADKPHAIDTIEWFASAEDLARLMDGLRRRSDPRVQAILGVRPALTPDLRAAFLYAGFKGGSEPGVINLTWLLRNRAGEWFSVAASWNDTAAPVDNKRFELLAMRLIALTK